MLSRISKHCEQLVRVTLFIRGSVLMIIKLHTSQKVTAGLRSGRERERKRGKKKKNDKRGGRRGRTRRLEGPGRNGETKGFRVWER